MSRVSEFLRKSAEGHFHWCPACSEMHPLPNTWNFNGDVNRPSYTPSFKHSGFKKNIVDGNWVGEGRDAWLYDAEGKPIPYVCHYVLTDGVIHFCGDCTHEFSGRSIPLPVLPEGYRE